MRTKPHKTDASRQEEAERIAIQAAFADMKGDADQVEAFLMDTGLGAHKLVAMLLDNGLPGRTRSKGNDAQHLRLTTEITKFESAFSTWSNTKSPLVHTTPIERYRKSIEDDAASRAKAA